MIALASFSTAALIGARWFGAHSLPAASRQLSQVTLNCCERPSRRLRLPERALRGEALAIAHLLADHEALAKARHGFVVIDRAGAGVGELPAHAIGHHREEVPFVIAEAPSIE